MKVQNGGLTGAFRRSKTIPPVGSPYTRAFQTSSTLAFRRLFRIGRVISSSVLLRDHPVAHSAHDSFTFYLESGVTKLSLLSAFPRRKILEELLEDGEWTPRRAIGLHARKEERKKKERLKGTYGARGSGRTRVVHSEDTPVSSPTRFCSFCTLPRTRIYVNRKRPSMKTANEPLFKINR